VSSARTGCHAIVASITGVLVGFIDWHLARFVCRGCTDCRVRRIIHARQTVRSHATLHFALAPSQRQQPINTYCVKLDSSQRLQRNYAGYYRDKKRNRAIIFIPSSNADCHGRWNRGSRESSCSPNFWHGRAGHSSCSPKILSLLNCDVRLSRIELDILKFCRSVGRSGTKKLSASGGLRPPDPPTRGSGPRWELRPQTPVIGSRSTRSPWLRPLLAPPTFKHFQRPC